MHQFDVVIIGAGAAGLFCAGVAGQSGLKVLVIDHSEKVAEKIRISGGGRCNFTNREVGADNFLSSNPRFARSALQGFKPGDFLALVQRHGIPFHEKHKGQLFCDRSAEDLINMLLAECAQGGITRWQGCAVSAVRTTQAAPASYEVDTEQGSVACRALVIASGGLSVPQIGASDFGYRVARQFGLDIQPTRPALVPLTFDESSWAPFARLSGLSLPVEIATGSKKEGMRFHEDLLFTHRGLSGPCCRRGWQRRGSGKARRGATTGIVRPTKPVIAPWRPLPTTCCAGNSRPPVAPAIARQKSLPAALTPAACRARPWNRARAACISLAKWWTLPAGWAATTFNGPGPAPMPARADWQPNCKTPIDYAPRKAIIAGFSGSSPSANTS